MSEPLCAHLDEDSLAQAGFHQGLGNPARRISSRTIHFGIVLPRESPSTMATPSAIRVDDDFAPCESRITLATKTHPLTSSVTHETKTLICVPNKSSARAKRSHLWTAHKKQTAGQEVVDGLVIQVLGRNDNFDHLLHQLAPDLFQGDALLVLY